MSSDLFIAKQWKDMLTEHGLSNLDDYFEHKVYFESLNKERSAEIIKVNFPEQNKEFFLKKNFSIRFRKVIRSYFRGAKYKTPAINEVDNIKHLKKHGFRVMDIVAYGYKSSFGYPDKAFILVEKVEGEEFIDLYNKSDASVRKNIYLEYGKLVGQLHHKSIKSTVRPQDLFCQLSENKKTVQLTLIDREVGTNQKYPYKLKQISAEIAEIFLKGTMRYKQVPITMREAVIFCKEYLMQNKDMNMNTRMLLNIISKSIKEHMNERPHYSRVSNILPAHIFNKNSKD